MYLKLMQIIDFFDFSQKIVYFILKVAGERAVFISWLT